MTARWKMHQRELHTVRKYEVRYRPVAAPGRQSEDWIVNGFANSSGVALVESELTHLFPDCEYEAAARASDGFAWGEWSEPSRCSTTL